MQNSAHCDNGPPKPGPDFEREFCQNLGLVRRSGHPEQIAEAEQLLNLALAIVEKALGPEHRYVAWGLENYAALLRATGRNDEAERMEARAKVIRVKHVRWNPAN